MPEECRSIKGTDTGIGWAGRLPRALNLPNSLTLLRIALIPFFVGVYDDESFSSRLIAAAIFLVAASTDLLDGYLARRRSEVTKVGKLLDPLADKLLVVSALILLVDQRAIPPWLVILLIGRELAVTGLRAVAAAEAIILPAESGGKYKTVAQIVAIAFLLVESPATPPLFHQIGWLFLILATLLSLSSAIQHFTNFLRRINLRQDKNA